MGWISYIRKGTLVIMDPTGDTTRRWNIDPHINYAFADFENKTAITASKDHVFLVDIAKSKITTFNGTLMGIDFTHGTFLTKPKQDSTEEKLIQRDFNGNVLNTYRGKEPFKQVICNQQSGEVLILTKSLQLIWLNNQLQIRSGFQITANDLYGFCRNGNLIYFIRDDYLTLFRNNKKIIDLSNFDSAYKWLNTSFDKKRLHITKTERQDSFDLVFPSDNLFWNRNN
jgi:hypothetical protein